jgi:hypothetical protein
VWSWHPLLVSSRRRRASPTGFGHVVNSPATEARRIRLRGEYAISRKTIAWGMPDVSGASAVNTRAHTHYPIARTRLRVHRAPGIPRALVFRGPVCRSTLGRQAPRDRDDVCNVSELNWIEARLLCPPAGAAFSSATDLHWSKTWSTPSRSRKSTLRSDARKNRFELTVGIRVDDDERFSQKGALSSVHRDRDPQIYVVLNISSRRYALRGLAT